MIPNVIKRNDYKSKAPASKSINRKVYTQLLADFPAIALQWILRNEIVGPMEVPLNEIDWSDRANWVASSEPKKVQLHIKLIKQGVSKPILLVKIPNKKLLFISEGHHRALGYEALNKPINAYIVLINSDDIEQAVQMHSKQLTGKSRLDGT